MASLVVASCPEAVSTAADLRPPHFDARLALLGSVLCKTTSASFCPACGAAAAPWSWCRGQDIAPCTVHRIDHVERTLRAALLDRFRSRELPAVAGDEDGRSGWRSATDPAGVELGVCAGCLPRPRGPAAAGAVIASFTASASPSRRSAVLALPAECWTEPAGAAATAASCALSERAERAAAAGLAVSHMAHLYAVPCTASRHV